MFGGHKKDKGFSSKSKVQHYHGDGTESIIMMGRPFRVLQKIGDAPAPYMSRRARYSEEKNAYVYLVENSSRLSEFPRHFALKRSFFAVDQVAEAHKELDIFSHIKDKNIVRVYYSEISRSEGKLGVSIAMEYCANNLYRRIRSGTGSGAGTRPSESEVFHVLFAITSAIGYLHSQQPPIAHRDIRPENILINNRLTGPAAYKLCNFGSATTEAYQCESREEASMAITDIEFRTNPGFRSPEMADPWSRRRICEKSDMWSIGVLLYFMMYLRLPFEPTNMALSGNPKVRYPAGSEGRYVGSLRTVIDHLLDPNPDTRWDVFALTNFLRFDEDASRHLGTFCFTYTEWPEGWEEQDVKVLNREQPAKAPPVTYGGQGAAAATKAKRSSSSRPPASSAAAPPASATVGMSDDAVQEAMMVLGGDPADDTPEMAAYRAQIIKEQEEAWERAKAAMGGGAGTASPAAAATPASPTPEQKQPEQQPAEAPAQEKPKDLFDDLFAGPAPEPQASNAQGSPASASNASPAPPAAPAPDRFDANDLFAVPPPQPVAQQPVMQQPMMQQPMMNSGFAAAWGSGAPMAPSPMGMGPSHSGWSPQVQPMPPFPSSNMPAPPGGMSASNNWGTHSPAPFAAQQQQSIDFLAGGSVGQPKAAPAPAPAPKAASPKAKDPFADLFS